MTGGAFYPGGVLFFLGRFAWGAEFPRMPASVAVAGPRDGDGCMLLGLARF